MKLEYLKHKIIKDNSGHLSFSSSPIRKSYCGILFFPEGLPEDPQKTLLLYMIDKDHFHSVSYSIYLLFSPPSIFMISSGFISCVHHA